MPAVLPLCSYSRHEQRPDAKLVNGARGWLPPAGRAGSSSVTLSLTGAAHVFIDGVMADRYSPSWPPVPSEHLAAIDQLLPKYGAERLGPAVRVPDSVVNENYRVDTASGPLFVRFHNARATREAVLLEHSVIRWASGRGIPVVLPMSAFDGVSVHALECGLASVYPWLQARALTRHAIGASEATALGAMLGQTQSALRTFSDPALPAQSLPTAADTEQALVELEQVAKIVRTEVMPEAERHALLEAMRRQASLLASLPSNVALEELPVQPIHGDYHNRNVLMDADGQVAAVVDWEMAKQGRPIYELLRCLSFSELINDASLVDSFMAGYHRYVMLTAHECAAGVELWWKTRLQSTWVYRTRFLEGDRRVERFLSGGSPVLDQLSESAQRTALARRLCS